MWVPGGWLGSPEKIDSVISLAKRHRLNTLFVQVRQYGDAYYHSVLVPERAGIDTLEPISNVLRQAHDAGLAVHASMNLYYVWSENELPGEPRHVVRRHPEWVLVDGEGRSLLDHTFEELRGLGYDGLYLDPGNRSVRHHLRLVVKEFLCRHDVDGLHLDYARYPVIDCGFVGDARWMLQQVGGRDLSSVAALHEGSEEVRVWRAWRGDQVAALVRGIRADVEAVAPGTCITAAVVPDPRLARENYGQDWVGWLNEGLVDAVVSMTYSTDGPLVRAQLAAGRSLTGSGRLYAGLGLFNQSCQDLIEKIDIARKVGCDGVLLLGLDRLAEDPAYRYGLSLGPFQRKAMPHRCSPRRPVTLRPPRVPWSMPQDIWIPEASPRSHEERTSGGGR